MYHVYSDIETDTPSLTPHLEGKRTKLKDAFSLARRLWREYRCETSGIHIEVCSAWGTLIANDPSDFTMRHASVTGKASNEKTRA